MFSLKHLGMAAIVAAVAGAAEAQPFNLRAWYAQGQVFVIWQFPAPPAVQTDTVEIYASAAAQVNTAAMQLVGRMFYPEYTGARLQSLLPAARLLVPTPPGGTYRLAPDEGCFVYTPHAAGNLFFAAVNTGSTTVNAGNSASTAFGYDPVNEPVRPQLQFSGFTTGGNPYNAYVIWADGRADHTDRRPDVPVLADDTKNGVPHVFTITMPLTGVPATPASCVFAHHGGGGEYQLFRPGMPQRANVTLGMTDGVVVTPDDSFYARIDANLERHNTSWFGYTPEVDPFSALPRTAPPDGTLVVNFTQRRVHWILDWLLSPRSPVTIDPLRVAMIGHSGGGRGTSHLTRLHPERFAAAVCYTPAIGVESGAVGQENFLRGTNDQNLPTNLIVNGVTLGVTDVFNLETRLSNTERDFPYTRIYTGKRDIDGPASWDPDMRAILDSLNDSRFGYVMSWDEREHGVEKWNTEDPAPGPDVAQWIVPPAGFGTAKTRRCAAQYLVDTYRPNVSFPGCFNSDVDPVLAGRQPDPGPGDPNLGDTWGTWTGYVEWESATIVDTATRWACTMYLTGLSTTLIDNAPVATLVTDMVPRRTRSFSPAEGTAVAWYSVDATTGLLLQSGSTVAEAGGVVAVTGLSVPRDPARVRVILCAAGDASCGPSCRPDLNGDGELDFSDTEVFLGLYTLGDIRADFNGDTEIDFSDIESFLARLAAGC